MVWSTGYWQHFVFAIVRGQLSGCVLMKMEKGYPSWQMLILLTVTHSLQCHLPPDSLLKINFCCFMGLTVRVLHFQGWMNRRSEALRKFFYFMIMNMVCFSVSHWILYVVFYSLYLVCYKNIVEIVLFSLNPSSEQVTWRNERHPWLASDVFCQPRLLFFFSVMKRRFLG